MQRSDGRFLEHFRPLCLQQGVLSHAQGSAYIESGSTKVMVGVFGPHESDNYRDSYAPRGRIAVDVSIVTFPAKPKVGPRKTSEEIELARIVYLAINGSVLVERFPKLVLDIHCTVLESDGSVASALINASSVALIHAGIEVKDVISSCTVSRDSKNALCVDPSASEEATQKGNVVVSISPASGEVTYVSVSGSWDDQELQQALRTGITGCAQVDQTVRSTIIQQAS